MPTDFDAYLRALASTALDDKTELTDRGALQTLLQHACDEAEPGGRVQHEPRRDRDGGGSPDYKVVRAGRIGGYVETKSIDENLSRVVKSDQIRKYRTLSDNILLTDYLDFCWLKPDGGVVRERLAHSEDLGARCLRLRPEAIEAVKILLRGFFSATPKRIGKAIDLALALASRAALLRDFLTRELARQAQRRQEGRLHALFEVFRQQIFHELTIAGFADAFAQMLAYGLFLARLNAGPADMITLANVRRHIPGAFSLIRELVRFLEEMEETEYADIRWVVEEVLSIVNGLDLAAIHQDLDFRARKAISRKVRAGDEEEHRLFERDPFIYFYEDFLKAYDPAMRKGRGVYYTPPPVVNFIIRAVDDILKDRFGIRDGLADHNRVTVLDFACGTGTFLLEAFQQIFANIGGPQSPRADLIVREHLTRNLFGFEFLIAPYTIAHLKLSQYLRDQGRPLAEGERLGVYLTNTLEPIEPQPDFNFPAISAEVAAAQRVKDRDILVIVGNPPYSGHSKNKGAWIGQQIAGYKYTIERRPNVTSSDGFGPEEKVPLGERNPKWLNDDYVKFLRFAQLKIDAVEEGVVGVITNHSWLDNPTFRGMRQSLMRTFDQIHVLDLHGNAKKRERAPDGGKDENVFDIEQGVAISLFVKKPGLERGVWRGDLWGQRLSKYQRMAEPGIGVASFLRIYPDPPDYLFIEQDKSARATYYSGRSLKEIFVVGGTGIITKRDGLTIRFTIEEMWATVREFLALSPEDARKAFLLPDDVRDWKVLDAQNDVMKDGPNISFVRRIVYAPFDGRFTYYTGRARGFLGWPVKALMDHAGENCILLSSRLTKDGAATFVVGDAFGHKSANRYDLTYGFPLFLKTVDKDNISGSFRAMLFDNYGIHYSAEEIFGYIYMQYYSRRLFDKDLPIS